MSPNDTFKSNWHIEAIAHELTRCHAGENRRLLITQPPRSLKSICASVAFPAWALGHDPTQRFLCVSYSEGLANEFTRQFRMVTESEWYRRVFPGMRLKTETRTEAITTRGGGRVALSVGGSITGRGADFIIIDDPLKAEDGASETARKRVIDWYHGTLSTRLNDKERGVIILVMQRLHQEDLAGFVIERGAGTSSTSRLSPRMTRRCRSARMSFTTARRVPYSIRSANPRETLERIKAEIGSLQFSAQYQQSPVPPEGNLVKREWFRTYDTAPSRGPGIRIVQSWDIATTTDERNDWSVCTTWAIKKKKFYLLDVWRARVEFPALRRKIVNLALAYQAGTVLIERAGPGLQLVQDLRNDQTRGFQGRSVSCRKATSGCAWKRKRRCRIRSANRRGRLRMMACRSTHTLPASASMTSGSSPSSFASLTVVASEGGATSPRSILLRYAGSMPTRPATWRTE